MNTKPKLIIGDPVGNSHHFGRNHEAVLEMPDGKGYVLEVFCHNSGRIGLPWMVDSFLRTSGFSEEDIEVPREFFIERG